jgi:hypothetical protein
MDAKALLLKAQIKGTGKHCLGDLTHALAGRPAGALKDI